MRDNKCPECKKLFLAGGVDIRNGKWISYKYCTYCKKYFDENLKELKEFRRNKKIRHRCKKCFHHEVSIIAESKIIWEYDARKTFFGHGDQNIRIHCSSCMTEYDDNLKIKPNHPNTPKELLRKIERFGLNVELA